MTDPRKRRGQNSALRLLVVGLLAYSVAMTLILFAVMAAQRALGD